MAGVVGAAAVRRRAGWAVHAARPLGLWRAAGHARADAGQRLGASRSVTTSVTTSRCLEIAGFSTDDLGEVF